MVCSTNVVDILLLNLESIVVSLFTIVSDSKVQMTALMILKWGPLSTEIIRPWISSFSSQMLIGILVRPPWVGSVGRPQQLSPSFLRHLVIRELIQRSRLMIWSCWGRWWWPSSWCCWRRRWSSSGSISRASRSLVGAKEKVPRSRRRKAAYYWGDFLVKSLRSDISEVRSDISNRGGSLW